MKLHDDYYEEEHGSGSRITYEIGRASCRERV